jgi:hypothetical protein
MMAPSVRLATMLLLAGSIAGAAGAASRARAADESVQAFLQHEIGMSAADLRDIRGRRAASRTLSTDDGREVATAGAVQIGVPAAFYVQQLQNVVDFKRSPAVLQIGVFSTPARVADVAELTLPRGDIDGLRRCRPQDCNLQLSAEAIERFRHQVNWDARDAAEQANQVMRQLLVDLVNNYRARGSASLMAYEDRRRPSSPADEFEALVADQPTILQRHPAFFRHVLHYPAAQAPATTDLIYWSKEKVGPAEIISVTHMAFGHVDTTPVRFAVASRQIYGSRYFDASLGVTLLLHDDSMDENATFLVYVNRSRVHVLRGFFGGVKRTVVRSRTRSTMAHYLEQARDMVERRFAEHGARLTHGAAAASR